MSYPIAGHHSGSVLFTTASMPVLTGTHRGCDEAVLGGIDQIREIVPESFRLHDKLRRVRLHFDRGAGTYDDVAERLAEHDKVLCVVNTRRDAFELYSRLPHDNGLLFHLSKMMCPVHIRETIGRIRQALASPDADVVRVVSTQLIEAGVDMDFPIVFRQEAGLDSVLQAAGRCNREGRLPMGHAFVFSLTGERPLPSGYISDAASACASLGISDSTDCFSPGLMEEYFKQFYCRVSSFDKGADGSTALMKDLLCKPVDFCFKTAAEQFKLITDDCISVIVNYGDSTSLVQRLKAEGMHRSLMGMLAQYTVGIRKRDFDKLAKAGLLEEVVEGVFWLPDREQYSEDTGLTTENHWLEEILIK